MLAAEMRAEGSATVVELVVVGLSSAESSELSVEDGVVLSVEDAPAEDGVFPMKPSDPALLEPSLLEPSLLDPLSAGAEEFTADDSTVELSATSDVGVGVGLETIVCVCVVA